MRSIGNIAISASAGTGKTYALAVRYIQLLSLGHSPESIAAMTFTVKAAGEILERIIILLCTWIADPARYDSERGGHGLEGLEHARLPVLLRDVLLRIHKLRIGTLDSFFAGVVKAFPFELGLNGDFQIMDSAAESDVKKSVLRNILYGCKDEGQLRDFLFDFKRATYGTEGKGVGWQLRSYVDECHGVYMQAPEEALWKGMRSVWGGYPAGLETSSGGDEAGRRLLELLSALETGPEQIEALCRFVNDAAEGEGQLGKESNGIFEKLLDRLDDIRQGGAKISVSRKQVKFDTTLCAALDEFLRHYIRKKLRQLSERTEGLFSILRRYDDAYERTVRTEGLFTFADVLTRLSRDTTLSLSGDAAKTDKLYIDYRLDSKIDHWLLDEFQDTNFQQWHVIENLIDEVMQDTGGGRSFFYVGDIKQAIYQWREGDPRLFNMIFRNYSTNFGNIEKKPLNKSYRSCRQITDTVNRVFGKIASDPAGCEMPGEVAGRMEWNNHESNVKLDGFAQLITLPYEKSPDDEQCMIEKAGIIARTILRVKPLERELTVAVLLRQHKHHKLISAELARHGIRATYSSENEICEDPLASVFLSLARFAEHPGDEFSWQHIRMTPLKRFAPDREALALELLEDIFERGYRYLVEKWMARLTNECGIKPDDYQQGVIKNLLIAAEEFDNTKTVMPQDFIEFVKAFKVRHGTSKNSVQLMTVHAAKGLGFDLVFLPELRGNKGIMSADVSLLQVKKDDLRRPEWAFIMPNKALSQRLPVLSEYIESRNLDQCYENLCLLYVAMTRAAKGLYMLAETFPGSTSLSLARLLENTLAIGKDNPAPVSNSDGGMTTYSEGDPEWYEALPFVGKSEEKAAPTDMDRPLRLDFGDDLAE
ncbi:MAG: UvrD-helicase domain-containing protein, partial [Victivallales bacterium]|nr:UvrD-helicase domain-containing protein [Victivallales bacterium]